MSALARVLGTWFYLGYVPKGPGTAGSLGALAIAWVLHEYTGVSALWLALLGVLLIAPAIWASGRVAKDSGKKDPQIVVIDEVVGQWITLAGASTLNCEELDCRLCAVPVIRHLEAAARTPTGTNPRRRGHCARRRDGRNLRCTCVVHRWMVQSVLAVLLWPFARIPNPDRRFQTFPRLRPSRAASSASAAKAWLERIGPRRASASCLRRW